MLTGERSGLFCLDVDGLKRLASLAELEERYGALPRNCVANTWEEAANLYIALVANSGLGKSPCFKEFLKPLWKAEIRHKEHWDSAMAGYTALLEERRQSKDRGNLPDLPSKPIRVQHIIEDATTEAIGGILADKAGYRSMGRRQKTGPGILS